MQIDAQHRALAAQPEVPLLRFQAALGIPIWAFGVSCGLLVFALLMVPAWTVFGEKALQVALGNALFFAVSFGILTAFTKPVYRGGAADLRALKPVLPLPEADLECLARGLTRATGRQLSLSIAIGLGVGIVHASIAWQVDGALVYVASQATATISLWVFMFTTLSKLILNAALFSRLGALAEPDLLRPSRQAPFGHAAIRPGLFLIGILCAFPLLFVGDSQPTNGVWLALLACLLTLFGIVGMPLRGIRERIKQRRVRILKALDTRLEAMGCRDLGSVSAQELRDMDTILDMRERVANAPAWPLDLAGVRRILLYIVLPPLTWAAAAFVEMFIDSAV